MENSQEQINGRLVAFGRAKYMPIVGSNGYVFLKDKGFGWSIDQVTQDTEGLTMDALNDCIEQLEALGDVAVLKKDDSLKDKAGFVNGGLVITSKKDPRITCSVTLVDLEGDDCDIIVKWFADLDRTGKANTAVPERAVDPEELKAVERAQEMTKEKVMKESLDELFELPIKGPASKVKKTMSESNDGWGIPVMEEAVVGVDNIGEKPETEGGKPHEEKAASDSIVKTVDAGKTPEVMKGTGGSDPVEELDLPANKVKPGTPEAKPKEMGESEIVGIDNIGETPVKASTDKDREEVDGEKKVKTQSDGDVMAGTGGQVGGTDKTTALPAAAIKPAAITSTATPKLMAEARAARLEEARKVMKKKIAKKMASKKKVEAKKTPSKKLAESKDPRILAMAQEAARARLANMTESKKKVENKLEEGYGHPKEVVGELKKHVEEAHRAIKKAHHLTEWAQKKVMESSGAIPSDMAESVKSHHAKIEDAKNHLMEARKRMNEVCEEVGKTHWAIKKGTPKAE